jgi:stress-induced morphogen
LRCKASAAKLDGAALAAQLSPEIEENPMGMSREILMEHLTDAFPEAEIVLTDLAGDNDHWQAEIISPQFAGIPRVKQHQLVYAALKGKMGGELHALALKTRAP